MLSLFNVSGFTTSSNNTPFLISLNISGRTKLGSSIHNYSLSDSVLEFHKIYSQNYQENKEPQISLTGDIVAFKAGEGNDSSYISLTQAGNIDIQTQKYAASNAIIKLTSNTFLTLNTQGTIISNNLTIINGIVTDAKVGVNSLICLHQIEQ